MLYFIEPHSLFSSDQFIEKALRPNTTTSRKLAYSMLETTEAYKISVDVPGIKAEDISITYDDSGSLSIKSTNEKGFAKSFMVDPNTIRVEAISASITDGVLTITAPKPEPKTIAVSSAPDDDSSETSTDNKNWKATMDVPGVRLGDLSIILKNNNNLRVQAVRRHASQQERSFSKTMSIDSEKYDVTQMKATLSHGVLVISVPRKPEMERMEIEIDTTTDKAIASEEESEDQQDQFQVSMDLPGVKKSDVSIQVEDNVLRIHAIRMHNRKKMRLAKETAFDPRRVQHDTFHATLVDGVLTVTAARNPLPAPKTIAVTDGGAASPIEAGAADAEAEDK